MEKRHQLVETKGKTHKILEGYLTSYKKLNDNICWKCKKKTSQKDLLFVQEQTKELEGKRSCFIKKIPTHYGNLTKLDEKFCFEFFFRGF